MIERIGLMSGVASLAFIGTGMAHAQEARVPAATAATEESRGLEMVVVTAQRRNESSHDVPVTVLTTTAEQLQAAGVVDTRDLNRVVPGFVLTSQNAWSSPSIRGVSSSAVAPGGEGPVALYVDGIYQPSQQGSYSDMPDVERVEVAKGPQGTLFGRNATAGAVQIFTKGPSFTSNGSFQVSDSAWLKSEGDDGLDNLQVSGFLAGPLIEDKLAGSIAVANRSSSGFSVNDVDGSTYGAIRSQAYRGKLLFKATDDLSISGGGFYTKRYDESVTNGGIIGNANLAYGLPGVVAPTDDYHVAFKATTPHMEYTERGGYLQGTLETGFGTITNTATYRNLTGDIHINTSSVAALQGATLGLRCLQTLKCLDDYQVVQPSESASNELLFSSHPLGPVSFVAGLYAYHESAEGTYWGNKYPGSLTPGGLKFFAYHVKTDSYAAFASADYNVTDQFHLTVGARYTSDTKKEPENLVDTSTTVRKVSPRVALRYDWTDSFNTYFTYSTGFRSGVYTSAFTQPALKPELLKSYEVGAKYEGQSLRLNLSAFHYDYSDLQLSTFTGVTAVAANASATLDGLDFDGEVRLNDNFKLRGGGSYLPKAEYNDYRSAVAFAVSPSFPVRQYDGTATCGGYCGVSQQSVNADSARMIKAPRFTGFAGVNYENAISSGEIEANLSAYYSSTINYDVVGIVQSESYVTLDGEASYSPASVPGFKLSIFATNLNNAKWKNGFLVSAAGYARYFSPPPQLGFRVGYSY